MQRILARIKIVGAMRVVRTTSFQLEISMAEEVFLALIPLSACADWDELFFVCEMRWKLLILPIKEMGLQAAEASGVSEE